LPNCRRDKLVRRSRDERESQLGQNRISLTQKSRGYSNKRAARGAGGEPLFTQQYLIGRLFPIDTFVLRIVATLAICFAWVLVWIGSILIARPIVIQNERMVGWVALARLGAGVVDSGIHCNRHGNVCFLPRAEQVAGEITFLEKRNRASYLRVRQSKSDPSPPLPPSKS